jgi:hypothetical protein
MVAIYFLKDYVSPPDNNFLIGGLMTIEDFAKMLIRTGNFELKIDVLSLKTGNPEQDKELPLTVVFKDKNGLTIHSVIVEQ